MIGLTYIGQDSTMTHVRIRMMSRTVLNRTLPLHRSRTNTNTTLTPTTSHPLPASLPVRQAVQPHTTRLIILLRLVQSHLRSLLVTPLPRDQSHTHLGPGGQMRM
jgi:hypothetical protein